MFIKFFLASQSIPGNSAVKNSLAIKETQVWSLGLEDPLEKKKGSPFRILAWRISLTEKPGGLQSMGSQE